MDPRRHSFKLGEVVRAKLIERVSAQVWIVDFAGQLLRVTNNTPTHLSEGQMISLEVTAVRPLQFAVTSPSARQRTL